jgi:hypothetical protein
LIESSFNLSKNSLLKSVPASAYTRPLSRLTKSFDK